ncbi:hypothetical protein NUW54_g9379 [Trametes sanguinea]|uniref:Uncharacterized protein n=1 Tax=Trametes sanguinea TaxID=158606 RepID=A0ACC1P7E0_9APHY|nr:hypothetical protein NUW54_g9379 [Trametes sanguinea]
MSDVANIRKQLKIKAGSAKRCAELQTVDCAQGAKSAESKEEEDLKRKLDQYVADNAEDWDIKNTVCGGCFLHRRRLTAKLNNTTSTCRPLPLSYYDNQHMTGIADVRVQRV